jgi:hypothetical protein
MTVESNESIDKARENRIRRRAQRLGFALRKSRARYLHMDDFGEYQLIDPDRTAIVWGEKFDLSLEDVERYLDEVEEQMKAALREEQVKDAA